MARQETNDAREIQAQHDELQGWLDRLGTAEDGHALTVLLDRLIPWMENHFAREEGPNGLVSMAEAGSPRHYELARTVVGEHGDLLRAAQALRDDPRRPEVARFVQRLRDHERRESELLVDMVYEDLGTGD
ncbi:MAG: hemerythrin domain-containing protein [Myxococcota bacterium]